MAVNAFALLGLNRLNLESDTAYTWINPSEFRQEKSWNLFDLHARWDSDWYLDIARNGYEFRGENKLSNIVFFPLYPALTHVVSYATGGNFALAGWLVSIVALFGALIYFMRLIRDFHPDIRPLEPIIFLLAFPTAFFLNAVYTESLFLLFSIGSIYYGLRGNWRAAGIAGVLASLTRVTGLLLFIPLAWEFWRAHGSRMTSMLQPTFLWLFAIPAGTASFFLYHWVVFGDPLLFLKVEKWWGRAFNLNQDHFVFFSNAAISNFALDILFIVVVVLAAIFVSRRLRVSYALYMLATLAVALSTGTLMSISRYILVLFPMFILLASLRNEYIKYGWLFASVLLLALNILLFVSNYWAG